MRKILVLGVFLLFLSAPLCNAQSTNPDFIKGINYFFPAGHYMFSDWNSRVPAADSVVRDIVAKDVKELSLIGVNNLATYLGEGSHAWYVHLSSNLQSPIISVPELMGFEDGDNVVRGDVDYDGNRKADLVVWNSGTGEWKIILTDIISNYFVPKRSLQFQWGTSGDLPVTGDYDGDGLDEIGVWRPSDGNWYIKDVSSFPWGTAGDVPAPGDYTGDGRTDLAVFRLSDKTWYVKNLADNSELYFQMDFAQQGDVPVPADYDGDGKTDYALWRPSTGNWSIKYSANGELSIINWGSGGDVPVPADYDGDGRSEVAVWRPGDGNWYVKDGDTTNWGTGSLGDVPIAADFDGDNRSDYIIWRRHNRLGYPDPLSNASVLSNLKDYVDLAYANKLDVGLRAFSYSLRFAISTGDQSLINAELSDYKQWITSVLNYLRQNAASQGDNIGFVEVLTDTGNNPSLWPNNGEFCRGYWTGRNISCTSYVLRVMIDWFAEQNNTLNQFAEKPLAMGFAAMGDPTDKSLSDSLIDYEQNIDPGLSLLNAGHPDLISFYHYKLHVEPDLRTELEALNSSFGAFLVHRLMMIEGTICTGKSPPPFGDNNQNPSGGGCPANIGIDEQANWFNDLYLLANSFNISGLASWPYYDEPAMRSFGGHKTYPGYGGGDVNGCWKPAIWKMAEHYQGTPPIGQIPSDTNIICNSNPPSEADIDNDGDVDVNDLIIVTRDLGNPNFNPAADVIPDGEIDIYDAVFVASRFT